MNKYINSKRRKNKHENDVQDWFIKNGYYSIARGWPDFCFFKMQPDGKVEAVFVEVKRPDQTMIKPHQNTIKKIFERLGLDVRVAFGSLEDGSPNFKEIKDRKIAL